MVCAQSAMTQCSIRILCVAAASGEKGDGGKIDAVLIVDAVADIYAEIALAGNNEPN